MPEPLDLSTPLAYAQAYARMGWHVLPIEPGAKAPIGRLVPRGMLDASTDVEVISRWWRAVPKAGVGIALAPSGLVALDIDPRNGGAETFDALQADHGSLRSEVMAFTGGGGEHHVFVLPPGAQVNLPGTLGPGVDVKANGYIVVEPSVHPSGKRYEWEASSNPLEGVAPSPLPDWLRSLRVELQRRQPDPDAVPVDPASARDVREALYMLEADSREDWLHAGMALHATGWGHPAYAMWCAWSQQSTKFDSTDQRKTWEGFKAPAERGSGLTISWIFSRAQESGWVNPRARIAAAPARPEIAAPSAERIEEAPEADSLPFMSLSELQQAAGAIRWVVKHAVPAESVGVIFGGSGTFKSFIALDMALHVAHGLPWLGRRTEEGPVLYIAAEGGAGLWRRIEAWHRARRLRWQDAPMYVVPVGLDLMQDASRVVEAAAKVGVTPTLVIVDTLSQTFSGEENSANEVAGYLRELGTMFRLTWQAAVAVVHHSGHQATERPRGSSAIRANVDWMLGVFRDQDEMLATVECHKQKDGERFADVSFRLTEFEIGRDEDGDPINTLVARHMSNTEEVQEAMAAEHKAGRGGHNRLIVSLASNGMSEAELRKAFYEDCDVADPDSRRQAYFRARKWATARGFFEVVQGTVVLPSNLKGRA
jgi:hypothetical protein